MAELQAAVVALQVNGAGVAFIAIERASRNAGDFAISNDRFSVDAHPDVPS